MQRRPEQTWVRGPAWTAYGRRRSGSPSSVARLRSTLHLMHGLKGGRRKGASATNRYCTGPPTLVARLRPTRPPAGTELIGARARKPASQSDGEPRTESQTSPGTGANHSVLRLTPFRC